MSDRVEYFTVEIDGQKEQGSYRPVEGGFIVQHHGTDRKTFCSANEYVLKSLLRIIIRQLMGKV